jgi:hypothetical protein
MAENTDPTPFAVYVDGVMDEIQEKAHREALQRRFDHALMIAAGAGDVLKTALGAGLPYSMAQEMAGDFWSAEYVAANLVFVEESQLAPVGEDDEDE